MTFVGSLVGTLVFAFLSDYIGRKFSLTLSWLVAAVGSIIFASASNIETVLAGIFIAGAGAYPTATITFIILAE